MKNRRKNNKKLLLILLILGVSIGFALLSTTLGIVGISGIKKNTWNIHWDDTSIQETEGSVTATSPARVTDTEKKNIAFTVDFELPGEYYEFTADHDNYAWGLNINYGTLTYQTAYSYDGNVAGIRPIITIDKNLVK